MIGDPVRASTPVDQYGGKRKNMTMRDALIRLRNRVSAVVDGTLR